MVKICGLKNTTEIKWATEAGADFVGMVVFFPKSKRNIPIEVAGELVEELKKLNCERMDGNSEKIGTQSVAVTVKPTDEQISEIERVGFDYLQYHGELTDEQLMAINIPVIKAFNVKDVSDIKHFSTHPQIAGFVFDANDPGSGKGFDYDVLADVMDEISAAEANGKFVLLAGGLGPDNVGEALAKTGLSGADTSSGVENESGDGKDKEKIFQFIARVRSSEKI